MRDFSLALCFAFLFSAVWLAPRTVAADTAQKSGKPNIVVMIADDLTYRDIGC